MLLGFLSTVFGTFAIAQLAVADEQFNPPKVVVKFPHDKGQSAEVVLTANGDSSPRIFIAAGTATNITLAVRSVNFPYRRLVIYRVEPEPALSSMQITTNHTEQAELQFSPRSEDPASGIFRVHVRDLNACEERSSASRTCQNFLTEMSSADATYTVAWTHGAPDPKVPGHSPLLGAGIGRLGDLLAAAPLDAFGGELDALIGPSSGGSAPFSAAAAYSIGSGIGVWSAIAGYFGQYPGYGFSGLVNGHSYGGFYDGTGEGFDAPHYQAMRFHPDGLVTGLTENTYYSSDKDGNFGVVVDSKAAFGPASWFGSSAFYYDFGQLSTVASSYHYLRIDSGKSEGRAWLVH